MIGSQHHDLADCQAAMITVARELGRIAARKDFDREQCQRESTPEGSKAGATDRKMQICVAAQGR
jgi:hypothetical protein